MVKKYGLNMLVPNEESLQNYLRKITTQVSGKSVLPCWPMIERLA
jgi:hypothetical protein